MMAGVPSLEPRQRPCGSGGRRHLHPGLSDWPGQPQLVRARLRLGEDAAV